MNETILYVRYYERIDDAREMITRKYYNLDYDDEVMEHDEKLGDIWPLGVFLADMESAARGK